MSITLVMSGHMMQTSIGMNVLVARRVLKQRMYMMMLKILVVMYVVQQEQLYMYMTMTLMHTVMSVVD